MIDRRKSVSKSCTDIDFSSFIDDGFPKSVIVVFIHLHATIIKDINRRENLEAFAVIQSFHGS